MKNYPSAICFLFLCTFSLPVHAIDLYGFGSYWEVEDAEGTWGFGLGAAVPLFTEHLRADGRVYFFENSDLDDDDELELVPIDFGLQFHILPDGRIDPYILGGASYVYADADRADIDSDFGAYVGGGVEGKLLDVLKVFGEVVYRAAELGSDRGARDEDVEVSGLTANAGLKLHF